MREGQTVARDDIVGVSGGSDDDHAGTVLHFGVRVGDRYVDPMLFFRPDDLTKLVRLVPTAGVDEQPWTPADERRELQPSLHLPMPAGTVELSGSWERRRRRLRRRRPDRGRGGRRGVRRRWLGRRPIGRGARRGPRRARYRHRRRERRARRASGSAPRDAHDAACAPGRVRGRGRGTPLGILAVDIVEIGRRFVDTVTAECSDDAPPADGSGGSAHRVMVVAGINSAGLAGDRGPTSKLDVGALGYRRTDGEVRYYSYAADGGPYVPEDTFRDLKGSGHLLADQLRAMQREQPGREVDLIADSQGGVVVDAFLHNDYAASDPTFPPIGTVVTLSSPHEGAPIATAAAQFRGSAAGRVALDAVEDHAGSTPTRREPGSARPVGAFAAHRRRAVAKWGARHFPGSAPRKTSWCPPPTSRFPAPTRPRSRSTARASTGDRAGPGGVAGGPRRARGAARRRA